MTVYTGTLADSGGDFANQRFVDLLKDNLVTEGWTLEYTNSPSAGEDREYILSSSGESTVDDIYIGLRSYHSVGADYYNISLTYFTGYVDGSAFNVQPGYHEKGLCAHNTNLGYWVFMDLDHIRFGLDIDNQASYEAGWLGKFTAFAPPSSYPYPVAVIGSLNGQEAVRYSTARDWGFVGQTPTKVCAGMRLIDGTNFEPDIWPNHCGKINPTYDQVGMAGADTDMRDTNGYYPLLPLILFDDQLTAGQGAIFGILQGVHYISGFNNSAGNTLVINTVDYVVIQNLNKNGFGDFIALELD